METAGSVPSNPCPGLVEAARIEVATAHRPAEEGSRSVGAEDRPCLVEDQEEFAFGRKAAGRVVRRHEDQLVADVPRLPCVELPLPSSSPSILCGFL